MATEEKGFFEKNKKVIIVSGIIFLAALLFVPDVYIKKYVPWIK